MGSCRHYALRESGRWRSNRNGRLAIVNCRMERQSGYSSAQVSAPKTVSVGAWGLGAGGANLGHRWGISGALVRCESPSNESGAPLIRAFGKSGDRGNAPSHWFASQPREKRRAAHTSFIRAGLSWATRFPKRCCDTVTALWRFTAQVDFMPSSSFRTTSDGTPRMVEVTGATVTDDK